MSDNAQDLVKLLEGKVAKARDENKTFRMVALPLVAVIIGGMLFTSMEIAEMTDAKSAAEASTGWMLTKLPEATASLRATVVDGAPDLARLASDSALALIPEYRASLEVELTPVIDEVCGILTNVAVGRMLRVTEEEKAHPELAKGQALQTAADALVARLDSALQSSMDETDEDGITARTMIENSLLHLRKIDTGLRQLASRQGDPKSREFVMAWLDLLAQYKESSDVADMEAYKEEVKAHPDAPYGR